MTIGEARERAAASLFQKWLYGFSGFAVVSAAFFVALVVAIAGPPNAAEAGASVSAVHAFACEQLPNELSSIAGCAQQSTARAEPRAPERVEIAAVEPELITPPPAPEEITPSATAELEGEATPTPAPATREQAETPRRATPQQAEAPRRATGPRAEASRETARRATTPAGRATTPRASATRQRQAAQTPTIPRLAERRAQTLPDTSSAPLREEASASLPELLKPIEKTPEETDVADGRQSWRDRRVPSERPTYDEDDYDPYADTGEDEYADASPPEDEEYYEEYRPRRRWRRAY